MASRWDSLLESKPIPLVDHMLDEVAKILAKDFATWPLRIDEVDLITGRQFADAMDPKNPVPSPVVYREAFKLARWEIERQLDAFDDYMRNQRWVELGLPPSDKQLLLLLNRWLVEQLLSLGEATDGRVTRKLMLDALDRLERRFFGTAIV